MSPLSGAQMFEALVGPVPGLAVAAWDGSHGGDPQGRVLHLDSRRALEHLVTSPSSELGLARAYLSGDLRIEGMVEGDPYPEMVLLRDLVTTKRRSPAELPHLASALAQLRPRPPALPPEETPTRVRRLADGLRHGRRRDAAAIAHHYDVSNRFYELVLGPSMTYTCAAYPQDDATLEEAQAHKHDLVCRKLGLEPGMRLLDVGCGWGQMVRHAVEHYGVTALGVTLSRQQASWGQQMLERQGLADRAEIRYGDYRDVTERGFDAVSSIGLTEHIGVRRYPAYFAFLRDRLRDEGRLLNHCITWADNQRAPMAKQAFVERYVFPDGELAGSGTIVSRIEDAGLEVRHHENLREHYARTCGAWCANLTEHWEECVAEAGLGRARVWGLYLAGSRMNFERRGMELHQVLAVRTDAGGRSGMGLRRVQV
ncbi:class I SAM-dependent methyltransferase [Serinicoccus hydrothermalis]|nr:class I SAM-dependent methyltransferase [Serinicoccus hydrothermalis]